MVPWSATEIGRYPWHLLPDLSGNLIAVVFVTASSALVQHHRPRGRRSSRSQPRAGIKRHRPGQHAVGRIRRLYRLRFDQPLRAQLQQRRQRPAVRTDSRRDFGADAGLRSDAARLHAEIRARRPLDLSGRGPAPQMDHSVAAAAFIDGISVVAGDHRHHRAMGFYRRHPDRRGDRLRDLRAKRLADRFHQIQLRRLGISQLARSLARRPGGALGAWRQDPGPQPAELSVLRLGQPALPARQGAAGAASGMPLPGVRLQAGHRHRFLGGLQFRPDQAGRPRPRHQAGAGASAARGREGAAIERVHLPGDQHRARTRSCAGMVRERDHRATSGPRGRRGLVARLVHRDSRDRTRRPAN